MSVTRKKNPNSVKQQALRAKKQGLKTFNGTPCKICSHTERFSYDGYCVNCRKLRGKIVKKWWREKDLEKRKSHIMKRLQKNAERDGTEFLITKDDLNWPEFCPVFGIKLNYFGNIKDRNYSPSIDRINPNFGYIKGNVHIISNRANTIKQDATVKELRLLTDFLEKLSVY